MPWIDDLIGVFSPRAAYQRAAWRQAHDSMKRLNDGARAYDGAARGRLTADWRAGRGSADAEIISDLPTLRERCRQMVRDNSYAAAGVRNLTAALVGDGIEPRAVHPDEKTAALAQQVWKAWAESRVDGREDFYGVQRLAVRSMIEGGEALIQWRPKSGEPDARLLLLEGDFLDHTRTQLLRDGGRIVGGVEYDANGARAAYWIFPHHPGDTLGGMARQSVRTPALDVDHLFEATRIGQSRGVPWFHAGLRRLRDVTDIEDAIRIKRRVEACLAVFRSPSDSGAGSPFGKQETQTTGQVWETLTPGMIIQGLPGESVTAIQPSNNGDGDAFLRGQLMAVGASIGVPYHVLTGDVSQANYSSLRAAMVVYWALLDDWICNTIVPQLCAPAWGRVMLKAALKLGKPELAQVTASWTPAPRAWVDPLKDVTAEIMEVRAGFSSVPESLSSRGKDWRTAFKETREVNALIDALGLAFDTDARRVNGSGALQPATGYLQPNGSGAASPANDQPLQ